ncbi:16S rRNA (guanine(527)-N(7))-methyltransferase RsmG [Dinoroseobacter sp. PD6]|uniref:16S rRNA (guanine(527)-N(7))-methyltransferase RsmG n=1 Tax=Dinoroseobacter sp. PD6 TaxID=3028384 RepID=UPI00237A93FB|nr:16S rRNA (guanine(527)-N(7))-methyltransferase RsmG [Dinoroseobacter sp. PD6]MDD9718092.1 16S rRNA (guanine(527)-N(7))-methyltransferase RsmG [Dinoroseobacter sp. PD6]
MDAASRCDLKVFEGLIRKWSPRINLVAPSTYDQTWERHILDSAQLYDFLPSTADKVIDLGSGGGLPVVVLGVLAKHRGCRIKFTAIESDARKCAFLRTAARELQINLSVITSRIEAANVEPGNVITARALAPVSKLLEFAEPLRVAGGTCLFLKGENVQNEVSEAKNSWQFEAKYYPSVTSEKSAILEIGEFYRA